MEHDEIWDAITAANRAILIADRERRSIARSADALAAAVATLTIQISALMAESPANHPDTKGA